MKALPSITMYDEAGRQRGGVEAGGPERQARAGRCGAGRADPGTERGGAGGHAHAGQQALVV